jgi:phage tail-like protein
MADNNTRYYPPVGFYFNVKVDGISGINEASFQEISGLEAKIQMDDIQEGGVNEFTRKLPKGVQYNNLVLKRGLIKSSPLMDWINNAVQYFIFDPKLVEVNLLFQNGSPSVNWTFINAYPVSVKVSDLNATENKIVVETLELAYYSFVRTDN